MAAVGYVIEGLCLRLAQISHVGRDAIRELLHFRVQLATYKRKYVRNSTGNGRMRQEDDLGVAKCLSEKCCHS